MNYKSIETRKALSNFLNSLNKLLSTERKAHLIDLNKIQDFLSDRNHCVELIGTFRIIIKTSYRQDDGSNIRLVESIEIMKDDFILTHFSEEGYFGEYYTNNETIIGKVEPEECIPDYLNSAFDSIKRILDLDGIVEVETKRFDLKTIRKKASAQQRI